MGDQTTTTTQLDQVGRALFLRKWAGVFARDEAYPLKGYCIVNLDASYEDGSHWIAVANGATYDTFGRCGLLPGGLACAGDGVPDQKISEKNCGQRCIAWLCVHQVFGIKGANLI